MTLETLLLFKAGKLINEGGHDPRQGMIHLAKDGTGLVHVQWLDGGTVEDDEIVFPGKAVFEKVHHSEGRDYILRLHNKDDTVKELRFRLQEPDVGRDQSICNAVNVGINHQKLITEGFPSERINITSEKENRALERKTTRRSQQNRWEMINLRLMYGTEVARLKVLYDALALGTVTEAHARKLHQLRTFIKKRYLEQTTSPMRQLLEARQLHEYNAMDGPSFELLCRSKTFREIAESACRVGNKKIDVSVLGRYITPSEAHKAGLQSRL